MPREQSSGGWHEVNPAFMAGFAASGIESAADFLELPGEVVSGHPDRHVVRVELPRFAIAFYLKRQHMIRRRERFRNWRAGFGWVSRCEREFELLKQLDKAGLPCPRWAAVGEDRRGRSFLLVEEVAGARDLRRVLHDDELSGHERLQLADRLGQLIARIHAAGFTAPDLTAKHVLVSPGSRAITPIDWQTSRRVRTVSDDDRVRSLAVLQASVAELLATPRERLRVLRSALGRKSDLTRRVCAEAERLAGRRSIREQRMTATDSQRLVWLDGEAVCTIPAIAAEWPKPAAVAPFYGEEPGTFSIRLPGGREGHLIRGRSFDPTGRAVAWLRGRPWRSPGVTLGRLLFHLERHGVPAPRLLAFGQRLTSPASAEWFVLHTPPSRISGTSEDLGLVLRQLHDAGCRLAGDPLAALGADERSACICDVTAIRLSKQITERDRTADLQALLTRLDAPLRSRAEASYQNPKLPAQPRTWRRTQVGARG